MSPLTALVSPLPAVPDPDPVGGTVSRQRSAEPVPEAFRVAAAALLGAPPAALDFPCPHVEWCAAPVGGACRWRAEILEPHQARWVRARSTWRTWSAAVEAWARAGAGDDESLPDAVALTGRLRRAAARIGVPDRWWHPDVERVRARALAADPDAALAVGLTRAAAPGEVAHALGSVSAAARRVADAAVAALAGPAGWVSVAVLGHALVETVPGGRFDAGDPDDVHVLGAVLTGFDRAWPRFGVAFGSVGSGAVWVEATATCVAVTPMFWAMAGTRRELALWATRAVRERAPLPPPVEVRAATLGRPS